MKNFFFKGSEKKLMTFLFRGKKERKKKGISLLSSPAFDPMMFAFEVVGCGIQFIEIWENFKKQRKNNASHSKENQER
jgi:hypothetical protein